MRFQTPEHAATAATVLSVDDELQPTKASKSVHVDGDTLVGEFFASEARVLRVVMASFYDMLGVVIRTLREFG